MIAVENLRKFGLLDFFVVLFFSALWFLSAFLSDYFLSAHMSFILSVAFAAAFLSFAVLLVRKAGAAVLFYLFGGIMGLSVGDLGPTGLDKVVVLLVAALVFELVFLVVKLEVRNFHLDIVFGAVVSLTSVPFVSAFLLSPSVALGMFSSVVNVALVAFFAAVIGVVVSSLVWVYIRNSKAVLRFRYEGALRGVFV